jgi:hypothetical protein
VRLVGRLDVRSDLGEVGAPTLIVVATIDGLVHPSHSERLLAGVAFARRADIRAGHNLGSEAPARPGPRSSAASPPGGAEADGAASSA